ncbi:uncharacterized protein LOC133520119 [Cydia pomonella]|uniref:uncharacterized protein LOC133520119 n=1 Tax=Cydia pomonella TaxID=82600 RepID=UPI002ADDE8F3|nr:uncharacterized protein LOC133520119 [Cydia pomonella]
MLKNLLLSLLFIYLKFITASKPHSKRPQEIWFIECQLGIIKDADCPVDGGWSSWAPWSPCRGPCDSMGVQIRTRQCENPPPSNDGTPCIGHDEETASCFLTDCTVDDYRRLASGNWPRMEAMHQLEIVPAIMERCLLMDCPYEAIEAALIEDNTWGLHPEALWNALQCVKQNMGCLVTGEWGAWGEWSSCSARCGKGKRYRLRRCDSPPPSTARHQCTGNPLENQTCEGDQCAIEEHVMYNVGAAWGEWQPWTLCSETCGLGARRRRRVCEEKSRRQIAGTWGTQCQGQHDELQVCKNSECVLDGGWSGWGIWGPCSRTCGAGRRIRYRTCTRPVPAGGGAPCEGPKTDIDSCHLSPCTTFSHVIAVLNGDSFLNYNFKKKSSTFFHLYIRFLPLSPYGTLVRRGELRNPLVRLSLQKWLVCLDASEITKTCNLHRVCSPSAIEPAVWHNVLVTITNNEVSLRLDDAHISIKSTFSCYPDLANDNMNIFIGEKLHGEIQEVVVNFIPMGLIRPERPRSDFYPASIRNVVFDEGNIEEGFLTLDSDYYLRLPCFQNPVEWQLELTVKPKGVSGTLVFLRDGSKNSWLHLSLQNMRLKLQVSFHGSRTESSGSVNYYPDEWLDIIVMKQRYASSVETTINNGERIYAVLEKKNRFQRKIKTCNFGSFFKTSSTSPIPKAENYSDEDLYKQSENVILPLCDDEFFVGSIPYEYKQVVNDAVSFSGVLALIVVNGEMQDLHKLSMERSRRDGAHLSSRTASVSGFYHEVAWGFSNRLNLTCLHARLGLPLNIAHWLFLDTIIHNLISTKTARSIDDGRVLRLIASADNERLLRGFYTCRSHSKRWTHNIVTYGVLGKVPERLSSPDTITAIALVTTLMLIIGTLAWMFVEALEDIKNGYGYYRDRHLTPEEEAEAICDYIDQNIHLIGSQSAAEIAKARARRKAKKKKEARSKESVAAQEPQGMMEELDSSSCSRESVPAIQSSEDQVPDLFRCEPCYVSSPRHGSNITPRPYLTSSSTETASPRVLCSRLLMSRGIRSKRIRKRVIGSSMQNSKLLTIKSSTFVDQSPARKVLERFQKLKSND